MAMRRSVALDIHEAADVSTTFLMKLGIDATLAAKKPTSKSMMEDLGKAPN